MGAEKKTPALTYRQIHDNPLSRREPGRETVSVLHRFDHLNQFEKAPDEVLKLIHQKAVESRDRNLLFALSELNYLVGERVRHGVKPWDPRDARDYYLASAVYAWYFLFVEPAGESPSPFDQRFRTACDLYNNALAWSLTPARSTNAVAILSGGVRRFPAGALDLSFNHQDFPWPLEDFQSFMLADQFVVRGLSVRNRQPGLGAPLVAVTRSDLRTRLYRCLPATAFLRLNGGWTNLAQGTFSGSLDLYSAVDTSAVRIGDRSVPLETDTTVSLAYSLNQSLAWRVGMMQFLSFEEQIPTDIYPTQPYRPGRVPVVLVHGTFSSPVWWAEMFNTLSADPELQQRCQFWFFVYNSGNPTSYSAVKLREALSAKIEAFDPNGTDPALQQIVVIGHSQGGLLTKLSATDTGDKLLEAVLKTNRLENLDLTAEQQARVRRYLCFEALPCIKRAVFISTPHRGSYLAGSFSRRLARKLVLLPGRLVNASKEFAGLSEKLDIPKDLRGVPTSLDSMSPRNPVQLALADVPLAPGVKGHSIIAVKGQGDFHRGKDGLVAYDSAHVDDVQSEFIVRGPHSCLDLPPTIEEVRRILHEHLASLPAGIVTSLQAD